jgi:hypothetical protein
MAILAIAEHGVDFKLFRLLVLPIEDGRCGICCFVDKQSNDGVCHGGFSQIKEAVRKDSLLF